MPPVLIPEYAPSCRGQGAEYDAPIHFCANPSSPVTPRKRRRLTAPPQSPASPTEEDAVVPKVPFVRTVSDTDVTHPTSFPSRHDGTAACRKRRRVQFDEGTEVRLITQLGGSNTLDGYYNRERPASKADLWYTRSELVDMKREARRQTRVQRTVGLDSSLTKVYMSAKNPLTTHGVIQSALELVRNPLFGELRGLERWGSDNLALSRGTDILRAKSHVLLHQSEASIWSTGLLYEKAMAETCAAVNEPAQKYAQVIGLVDYILAQE